VSHPQFKQIGSPAMRLVEECGEVIKATMKGERFGWHSFLPGQPGITNLSRLRSEIEDVMEAFRDLELGLGEQAVEGPTGEEQSMA
jgi:NTP pyrophosphatase (non-canonical NTP hydrolase)